MIRFLQTDNRITKALLVVIIGAASVSMCVYLIPGLMAGGSTSATTFAVVYPHWYSSYLSTGDEVSQVKVEQVARQQLQQRNPQYADNPMILNFFEAQVGQQLVQQQVLLQEAAKLGIRASSDDVSQYLRTGPTGEVLFPDGKFIGQEQYQALIAQRLNMSITDFEDSIKTDIVVRRLQALVTAGVTVSDQEVRDTYRKQNVKIKFDYAVISSDDLRKSINPSDSDLEAFFKKNAARYASAVPEQRKITYFAFTPNQLPGGVPQPTQQQIQQYFTRAPVRVFGAGAGSFTPHPHLGAAGRRQGRCGQPRPRRRPFSSNSSPAEIGMSWRKSTPTIRAARTAAASWALRNAARWCPSLTTPSSRRRSATSRS